MKRSLFALVFIVAAVGTKLVEASISLGEAYWAAVAQSDALVAQEERGIQASSRVAQSRAVYWPKLSAGASYVRQGTADDSSTDPNVASARVTLAQSLWRGGADSARVTYSLQEFEEAEAESAQAQLELYANVGQSYYEVLLADQELKDSDSLMQLTERRISELEERAKIGRTRRNEVLTAQTQFATLRAQFQIAQSVARKARDRFARVTGLASTVKLVDNQPGVSPFVAGQMPLASVESFLVETEKRPDLLALHRRRAAAEASVGVARAGHFPTVDFVGNYYVFRTGPAKDLRWDLGLSLGIPLFEGGVVQARVAESASQVREIEARLRDARRSAELDVRLAYENVVSGLEQRKTLEEALHIAEKNYSQQDRDYQLGLSTNLDVLQAVNILQDARRSFSRVRYQTAAAWVALQAAVGKLP